MNKSLTLPLLLMAVFYLAAPVFAKECKGVSFPEQTQVDGSRLTLNGLGLREATIFKVDVYVAALYLESKSGNPDDILKSAKSKRLILHFVRDVGRSDITKAWQEGFEANAGNALPSLQDRINTLNGWMTKVKTGERLSFTYLPGTGVQVDVAGTTKGALKGEDFARALFAIWLGANPPNPELKSGLLGGNCG